MTTPAQDVLLEVLAIYDAMTAAEMVEHSGLPMPEVRSLLSKLSQSGQIIRGERVVSGGERVPVWMLADQVQS